MSPFIVTGEQDKGYQAAASLSGTRFRTSLEDTPASVSVFTQAFIEDLQIQNVNELADYTLSQVIDVDDTQLGFNQTTNAMGTNALQLIRIRGLSSNQTVDYFNRLVPSDSYNVGRYDENRGPNGVLFGVGDAGGINNSETIMAGTRRNSGKVSLSFPSNGGMREEARYNQVIVPGKLGVAVAGLNQNYEGWKWNTWNDQRRLFGAMTYEVNRRLTLRASAETGHTNYSTEQTETPLAFGAMVYTDWSQYLGGNSQLLFAPTGSNPNAAQKARGLGNVVSNPNGSNPRLVYVDNDGAFYDSSGAYTYNEYSSAGVNGPNWTAPSFLSGAQRLGLNRPDLFPYSININGAGTYRDNKFHDYTFSADLEAAQNLYFNAAFNYQKVHIFAPHSNGFAYQITVDPNLTRGVPTYTNHAANPGYGGANPYAGDYMTQAAWALDVNDSTYQEGRVSASYSYDFQKRGWGFLGSHQIAVMASRSTYNYQLVRSNQGFFGAPFSADYPTNANRLYINNYFTLAQASQDPRIVAIAPWWDAPKTVNYNGRTLDIGWVNVDEGTNNTAFKQNTAAYMVDAQSNFWNRRIVTTLGYRLDEVTIEQYGYGSDPQIGTVVDKNIIASQHSFSGRTATGGVVFHGTKNLDLIANGSSNIGIPDARQTVLPNGDIPDPPRGRGQDYGIGFHFLNNRIQGRLTYYITNEKNLSAGGGNYGNYNTIMTGLGDALIAAGVYTADTWNAKLAELGLNKTWSGVNYDERSKGFELNVTANLTPNWRLMLNASKTDQRQTGRNTVVAEFYGWTVDPNSQAGFSFYQQGVTTDSGGTYRITNPDAYAAGGGFAKIISLGQQLPAGESLETLPVGPAGQTPAYYMYNIMSGINRNIEQYDRSEGLRPYRFAMFTAYDFSRGFLKGFSLGGGFSWQDHANTGLWPDYQSVRDRTLLKTNLMVRYRFKRNDGFLKGVWTIQCNVENVLNDTTPLLSRYQTVNDFAVDYQLPNGWGPAVQRWDLVQRINARTTITYEF